MTPGPQRAQDTRNHAAAWLLAPLLAFLASNLLDTELVPSLSTLDFRSLRGGGGAWWRGAIDFRRCVPSLRTCLKFCSYQFAP
jgi:hypothetical protein